jgi:hypothetical protein
VQRQSAPNQDSNDDVHTEQQIFNGIVEWDPDHKHDQEVKQGKREPQEHVDNQDSKDDLTDSLTMVSWGGKRVADLGGSDVVRMKIRGRFHHQEKKDGVKGIQEIKGCFGVEEEERQESEHNNGEKDHRCEKEIQDRGRSHLLSEVSYYFREQ